ncbi:MAG: FAD-binding oxidoreductase [Anaerolinea sp.]|nr:FAD-binding oxidoreductase [Anaerolinea sp.]
MTTLMGAMEISGAVLRPGDAEYDQARLAWNRAVTHAPALIVLAQNADDVSAAVRFAAQEGLSVAVQSTGHGTVRPADENAVLIVTSALKGVRVDAERRTAWIGAGNLWGEVVPHTAPLGLTPLFGSSPGVGVVGYTLGGGMGWFGRKYGLAVDTVISLDVVTADGEQRKVSADENADLFWALRGGGGAFAVVTGIEVALFPSNGVLGGNLLYPAAMAGDVMRFYREWITRLPDEFTTSIVLMNFPPFPFIPEPVRGKSFVMVRGAYAGDPAVGSADGMRYVQEWLDWRQPVANMFHPTPVTEMKTISNDPENPTPGGSSGAWLRELSDEVIDTLIRRTFVSEGQPPLIFSEVRHAGGAIARVPDDANAYSHRDELFSLYMVGITPTPEIGERLSAYLAQTKRELGSAQSGAVYLNFLEREESRERVRDAYTPEKFARLVATKAKYDPDNRFGYAFNIPVK